jgi:hypothetical protein
MECFGDLARVDEQPPGVLAHPELASQQLDRMATLPANGIPHARVFSSQAVQLRERRPAHQIDGRRRFCLDEMHDVGLLGEHAQPVGEATLRQTSEWMHQTILANPRELAIWDVHHLNRQPVGRWSSLIRTQRA